MAITTGHSTCVWACVHACLHACVQTEGAGVLRKGYPQMSTRHSPTLHGASSHVEEMHYFLAHRLVAAQCKWLPMIDDGINRYLKIVSTMMEHSEPLRWSRLAGLRKRCASIASRQIGPMVSRGGTSIRKKVHMRMASRWRRYLQCARKGPVLYSHAAMPSRRYAVGINSGAALVQPRISYES